MKTIAELEADMAALNAQITPLVKQRDLVLRNIKRAKEAVARDTDDMALLVSEFAFNPVAYARLRGMVKGLHPALFSLNVWYPASSSSHGCEGPLVLYPTFALDESTTPETCEAVAAALIEFRRVIPQEVPETERFPKGMRVDILEDSCGDPYSYSVYYNTDGTDATLYKISRRRHDAIATGTLAEVLKQAATMLNDEDEDYCPQC